MQKEIAEFNAQRMKAARANDTKLLEKLKKKQAQINSMQMKMSKPQFLLLPITAIYFVIWPILNGYFPHSVAYVPGIAPSGIPFVYWYMLCSFFFGTLASKVIGVTPIE
jgi:uncharacterized membrane protein (DUF106 family)